jgi:hypothetical protein
MKMPVYSGRSDGHSRRYQGNTCNRLTGGVATLLIISVFAFHHYMVDKGRFPTP